MAKAATPAGTQTSRKAGVRSTAKKMDSTRHGFGTEPAARKADGAFGKEGRGATRQPGAASAKPGRAAALREMKTAGPRRTGR